MHKPKYNVIFILEEGIVYFCSKASKNKIMSSQMNSPADSNEPQNVVPWISVSQLDHTNCNGGNCEVAD